MALSDKVKAAAPMALRTYVFHGAGALVWHAAVINRCRPASVESNSASAGNDLNVLAVIGRVLR
jgi:hypothetical protein